MTPFNSAWTGLPENVLPFYSRWLFLKTMGGLIKSMHFFWATLYINYDNALDTLECKMLEDRRTMLCANFAKKLLRNPRYQAWFCTYSAPPPPTVKRDLKK